MRSLVCVGCGWRRVLYITQLADRVGPAGLTIMEDPHRSLTDGVARPRRLARRRFGRRDGPALAGFLEAYTCQQCGYTELYAQDISLLEPDGVSVFALEGSD